MVNVTDFGIRSRCGLYEMFTLVVFPSEKTEPSFSHIAFVKFAFHGVPCPPNRPISEGLVVFARHLQACKFVRLRLASLRGRASDAYFRTKFRR
jgi:hypothetical protein